jgi:cellulose synthase/poly-beta-1,6-N-acetylglucosamine synthase-like glycosyltransferase
MIDFQTILSAAGSASALLTIPGSVELGMLTLANALPRHRTKLHAAEHMPAMAVIVPAHNECQWIARCVRSVLDCHRSRELCHVFVVADNCTDDTAALARGAGAQVLERTDPTLRGKGYALKFAFDTLKPRGFDAFLIVDADSEVDPSLIETTAEAFARGADAVQCVYRVAHPERSPLLDLALRGFNFVRPRGRSRLGLSAGILGNGFGLSQGALGKAPYTADSIVEDLEYHLDLVRAGIRVEYLENTAVYGAMPVNESGRASQRARWEGGRFAMLRLRGAALFADVAKGKLALIEPLLDLLTLPLAFHTVLLLVALASNAGRIAAAAGFFILSLHLIAAIAAGNSFRNDLRTLARVPQYLAWKLARIPQILRGSSASTPWIRTPRTAEGTANE